MRNISCRHHARVIICTHSTRPNCIAGRRTRCRRDRQPRLLPESHPRDALVGIAHGTFDKALAPHKVESKTFSNGPALIEALFAGEVDIGYVGPDPAINGYVKSKGDALRIVAGASSGGALFVVRPDAKITAAKDLAGKKLATPQLGGTQDIALRYYLQQHGLKTADKGGDVQIVPTQPADILTLFARSRSTAPGCRSRGPRAWSSKVRQGLHRRARAVARRQVRHHGRRRPQGVPRRAPRLGAEVPRRPRAGERLHRRRPRRGEEAGEHARSSASRPRHSRRGPRPGAGETDITYDPLPRR